MKNRLMISCKRIVFALAFTMSSLVLSAEESPEKGVTAGGRIDALDNMSFIEMLNSVDVGKKSDLIQKFQAKEGKNRLLNGKYSPSGECTVEALRNKEVLLITIPAHLLFSPNKTELRPKAGDYLVPVRRYLKDPDMYRVMLVMHTDNTGSEVYREQITTDRVNAVFDWFDESGSDTRYLFSYSLADDMPLKPNDSMENRDKNRRLEIYLVPGAKMLEQAQKGRIAF